MRLKTDGGNSIATYPHGQSAVQVFNLTDCLQSILNMSKQTLLFSFLNKSLHVSVEREIKGGEQEMNEPLGENRAVCTRKYGDSYIAFVFLETCDNGTCKTQ
jgi:hypothetical protein